MRAPRLLPPSRVEATANSAEVRPSPDLAEQVVLSVAWRASTQEVLAQPPPPGPAAPGHAASAGEPKDRWPALPHKPTPDPLEALPAFWREQERRRFVNQEQEGTYGPRRFSH